MHLPLSQNELQMKNVTLLYPFLLLFLFVACQPEEHELPDAITKQEKASTKFRLYTANGDNSESINYLSAYLFENGLFIEEFTNLIPDSNNEISLEFNKKTGQHLYFVANATIDQNDITSGITTENSFNRLAQGSLLIDPPRTFPLYFLSARYDISSETHANIELLRSIVQINFDATAVPEILINQIYIFLGQKVQTYIFYQGGYVSGPSTSFRKDYTPAVSGLKETIRLYENISFTTFSIYFTYNGVSGRCDIPFPKTNRNELYYIRLRKDDTDTTIHGDLSILPWTSGDDINAFPD